MNRQSAGKTLEVLNKYKELNSIIEVAKSIGISYESVRKILRENGYASDKKKPVKSNNLRADYFENIDSEDKAYFLGFIKADGYIDHLRNRFALRIQERDIEILKKFCDALNLPQERINFIQKNKNSKYYTENMQRNVEIAITHKIFVEHFSSVKTESILDKIPERFTYDFIRGYFDGDGSINYREVKKLKFSMNIMGSPGDNHMLKYIQRYFNINEYLDKRSNLPFLQTVNPTIIEEFRDKCYSNCYIYLSRKKQKFDLFKFIKETSTTTRGTSLKDDDIV